MSKSKQNETKRRKNTKPVPADQFLLARFGRAKLKENEGECAERILDRLFDIAAGNNPGQALQALRFVGEWCGPKTSTGVKRKAQASPQVEQRKPELEQSEEELKKEITELDAEIKELQSSIGSVAPANS
jgi:hypothetical protein